MSRALLIFFLLVGGCNAALSCNLYVRNLSESVVYLKWNGCGDSPLRILYHGRAHCGVEIPSDSTAEFQGRSQYTFEGLEEFTNYTFNLTSQSGEILSTETSAYTRDAEPTGQPLNLTAKSVSNDTVELTWKREKCLDRNGVITGYVIQYRQEYGNITFQVERAEDITSHPISSLATNTTYRFQVATENTKGTGPFSEIIVTTLPEYSGVVTTLPEYSGVVTTLAEYSGVVTTLAEEDTVEVTGTTSSSSPVLVELAVGAAAVGGVLLTVITVMVLLVVMLLSRNRKLQKQLTTSQQQSEQNKYPEENKVDSPATNVNPAYGKLGHQQQDSHLYDRVN